MSEVTIDAPGCCPPCSAIPGVTVHGRSIRVSGIREMDALGLPQLRSAVHRALTEGNRVIELDLDDVHYLDLRDLGALTAFARDTRERVGPIRLLNLKRSLRWTLEVTRLTLQFDLPDS